MLVAYTKGRLDVYFDIKLTVQDAGDWKKNND